MVYVNITGVVSGNISFAIVANNFRAWIEPHHRVTFTRVPDWRADIRFYIGDLGDPLTKPRSWWQWVDVWWLDTTLYYENLVIAPILRARQGAVLWVTSMYNAKMVHGYEELMKMGMMAVVHRLVHPLYFLDWSQQRKEYDFIGVFTDPARKNARLFRKICRELKARCLEVSPNGDIKTWTLTERDKIKLLLKARWLLFPSRAEGFGMPVLEANILGVPALYTDGHAVKEFACGIPLRVREVNVVRQVLGLFKFFEVDENAALEAAKKAIEMSKDEYQNLSEMCKEYARLTQESYIHYVLDYIDGIRR